MKNGVKGVLLGSSLLAVLALSACGKSSEASTNSSKKENVAKVSSKNSSKKEKSAAMKKKAAKESAAKKESEKKAQEQKAQEASQKASAESAQNVQKAAEQAQAAQQQTQTDQKPVSQSGAGTAAATPASNASTPNTSNNAAPAPAPAPAESKVLGVPFVSQGSTMLCEGSSLLEALHYKGVTGQGIYQFVNSMPKSADNNPYNGYAGEWNRNVDGTYQGMMAGPVVQWAAAVGGHATQISGPAAIKNSIRNGNPVVAWIVYDFAAPQFKQMPWGRAVWNGHVVCVDGFNQSGYHIVDPNAGAYWVSAGTFESSNGVTGMAVSVG
ncbi:C39 family peptidase [Latilactobacillus fragifolii]|uniref:C39 family peptidase n=1 Tax=Latilactobacillus fragifolii TaxID=2814244 RepID=UPI001ABA0C7E|nr:C39 family peptidase [Latilactobacillus fragifolii]